MTQQVVRARVSFLDADTLQDNPSMDFYFEATGSDADLSFTTATAPQTAVAAFFNSLSTGQSNALCLYMSDQVSRAANAASIAWTDITGSLDGSPAGAAFRTDTFTLGAGETGQPLPAQIACCVGYRAAYGTALEHAAAASSLPSDDAAIDEGAPTTHSGVARPRARLRGRFYLGPLDVGTLSSTGDFSSAFLTDVLAAANGLLATTFNPGSANQFYAVQWSRRNAAISEISMLYVDEGPATQRRRQDTTVNRVHVWTT